MNGASDPLSSLSPVPDTGLAAALNLIGGLLGVEEFPLRHQFVRLLGWLSGFGLVRLVEIEVTGSYGVGLARHGTAASVRVIKLDRSHCKDRRHQDKPKPSMREPQAGSAIQTGLRCGEGGAGPGAD